MPEGIEFRAIDSYTIAKLLVSRHPLTGFGLQSGWPATLKKISYQFIYSEEFRTTLRSIKGTWYSILVGFRPLCLAWHSYALY